VVSQSKLVVLILVSVPVTVRLHHQSVPSLVTTSVEIVPVISPNDVEPETFKVPVVMIPDGLLKLPPPVTFSAPVILVAPVTFRMLETVVTPAIVAPPASANIACARSSYRTSNRSGTTNNEVTVVSQSNTSTNIQSLRINRCGRTTLTYNIINSKF